MSDSSFTIGATVDVSQLSAGMNQAGNITKEALDKMMVDFSTASSASSRAVAKITDDTRTAALSVDENWQRVTKAALAYTSALKEVSGATYLARAAGGDDAAATSLLAAAKQKAAAAALELKEAQDATTVSTTKVAGAMGMARVEAGALTGSTGMMVGGLARLAGSSETLAPLLEVAFPIFGAVALVDILKSAYVAFGRATDQIMGYTQAVKESEKEAEKASTSALGQAGSLEEAQSKISATVKGIGDIANESFAERWGKAARVAQEETSSLWGPLTGVIELYKILDTAESGAADQAVKLAAAQSSLFKASLEEQAGQSREAAKLIDAKTAAESAGSTRVQAIRDEIAALGDKQAAEERIAAAEASAKHLDSPAAAQEATRTAKADVDEEFYLKRIELTNQLSVAEVEEAAKATGYHDALAQSATRVVESYNKLFETLMQIQKEDLALFTTSQIESMKSEINELGKLTEARKRDAEEEAKRTEQGALKRVDASEAGVEGAARLQEAKLPSEDLSEIGRAKATEQIQQRELAQLQAFEDEKLQIQMDALSRELSLLEPADQGPQTAEQYEKQKEAVAKVYGEIETLKQAHVAKMNQFDLQESLNAQAAANKQQEAYMRAFQGINQGFETATRGMLEGTMTVERAFYRMWGNILMSTIQSLEQMVLKAAEQELAITLGHLLGVQTRVAATASGAAQTKAISATSALSEIVHAAATAAAKAYSAMSGIPGVGPVLGAIAAAATFTAVMGFEALASAEQGMVSGQEQLAFLHKNEMVLPAPLSRGFQNIIGNMTTAPAGAPGGDGGAGGRGGSSSGTTHNYGDVHVSAFDAKGVADMIHRNKGEFTRAAAGIVRNGWRPR